MSIEREILQTAIILGAAAAFPTAAIAQSSALKPASAPAKASPPAVEQQWKPVQCASCQKAGVSLEYSRMPTTNGRSDGFIVARVRNLTQKEVKGSIEVLDGELPDSEGYIPSQVLWFVLSPLGSDKGEQLVLLPSPTPVYAVAHSVGQW